MLSPCILPSDAMPLLLAGLFRCLPRWVLLFFIGPPLFVCHWAYAKICVTIKFVKGGSPWMLQYPSNQIPCPPALVRGAVLSKMLLSGRCPLSLILGFSQFNARAVVTLTRLDVAVGFCSILLASRRCTLDPHRGGGRARVT